MPSSNNVRKVTSENYPTEAGHTPDHTGKVGVYIALPRLVDNAKHLDVALTAILFVQLVCRFDAVDFPGCPDAVIKPCFFRMR